MIMDRFGQKNSGKKHRLGITQKKSLWFILIMLIPALYGIFRYIFINVNSIVIAFSDASTGAFTLRYFSDLFAEMGRADSTIFKALLNTFKFFGVGVLKLFLSYIIAYFLYKKILLYKGFRFLFFLPSLVAPVVNITIYVKIIGVNGAIHQLTGYADTFPALLSNADTTILMILLYDLLFAGLGANFLILLGAMNRIPSEILESGKIDGCNAWREFWQLITPLVWDNFSTLLVLALTKIFTASGPTLYFTGGQGDPYTLTFWIYDKVRDSTYNYPAAVGLFFTVIGIPIVFGIRWGAKKVNPEVAY